METDTLSPEQDLSKLRLDGSTTSLSKSDPMRHPSETLQTAPEDQMDIGVQSAEVGSAHGDEGSDRDSPGMSEGGERSDREPEVSEGGGDDEVTDSGSDEDSDSFTDGSDEDSDSDGTAEGSARRRYHVYKHERKWDYDRLFRGWDRWELVMAVLRFRDALYEMEAEAKKEKEALRRKVTSLKMEMEEATRIIREGQLAQEGLRDEIERLKEISGWRSLYAEDVDDELRQEVMDQRLEARPMKEEITELTARNKRLERDYEEIRNELWELKGRNEVQMIGQETGDSKQLEDLRNENEILRGQVRTLLKQSKSGRNGPEQRDDSKQTFLLRVDTQPTYTPGPKSSRKRVIRDESPERTLPSKKPKTVDARRLDNLVQSLSECRCGQ